MSDDERSRVGFKEAERLQTTAVSNMMNERFSTTSSTSTHELDLDKEDIEGISDFMKNLEASADLQMEGVHELSSSNSPPQIDSSPIEGHHMLPRKASKSPSGELQIPDENVLQPELKYDSSLVENEIAIVEEAAPARQRYIILLDLNKTFSGGENKSELRTIMRRERNCAQNSYMKFQLQERTKTMARRWKRRNRLPGSKFGHSATEGRKMEHGINVGRGPSPLFSEKGQAGGARSKANDVLQSCRVECDVRERKFSHDFLVNFPSQLNFQNIPEVLQGEQHTQISHVVTDEFPPTVIKPVRYFHYGNFL
ncbi:hypothetical protein BDQ12DRAFT_668969 [Crucibulum laeve]|uniref:Uncharacterized protein n=1 Tax=Crucibulum laeve TaxID=68775 RepID=A0A5C3LSQ1_9AGAR|nr:hypothetical protein BDQ12DRAFT_668969 [Crucibulum laeve]